jgi:Tfp pilus assembly protein PilF
VIPASFPSDAEDVRTWPACARLLSHALIAVDHADRLRVAAAATTTLLNNVGAYARGRAPYAEARAHFERALRIDEAAYGLNHPDVASDVNNPGRVLQDLRDLAGARAHYERALRIDEAAYGPDHPTTKTIRGNLDALGGP